MTKFRSNSLVSVLESLYLLDSLSAFQFLDQRPRRLDPLHLASR
jgi:hypothetical protein